MSPQGKIRKKKIGKKNRKKISLANSISDNCSVPDVRKLVTYLTYT